MVDIKEIAIERGVEFPKRREWYAYPHDEMNVGDSFTVSVEDRARVLNANYRAYKRLGWKFRSRTEDGVIRIWRVT